MLVAVSEKKNSWKVQWRNAFPINILWDDDGASVIYEIKKKKCMMNKREQTHKKKKILNQKWREKMDGEYKKDGARKKKYEIYGTKGCN